MENKPHNFWHKCSSCKKNILLEQKYYVCSVSTCNGQRTGYVFCSVDCFEVHLPGARHRQAGAIEKKAPSVAEQSLNPPDGGDGRESKRILIRSESQTAVMKSSEGHYNNLSEDEVLVIASRLKDFIQAKSEFNTSASVMKVLSQHIRILCLRAIENARSDGRKTVLDRDFDFLKK